MSIPGSNLLRRALRIIAQQNVSYQQYLGRTLNAVGQDVANYAPPAIIRGSWQAVQKNLYQEYGLDLTKTYFMFYVPENILTADRNVSGDKITFNGKTYQCESKTDWFFIDGWVGLLCVELNN